MMTGIFSYCPGETAAIFPWIAYLKIPLGAAFSNRYL